MGQYDISVIVVAADGERIRGEQQWDSVMFASVQ